MKEITWQNYLFEGTTIKNAGLDSIVWDGLKLVILLKINEGDSLNKIKKITLTFTRRTVFEPFAYRLTNESHRQRTWNLSNNSNPVSAVRFTIESEFIEWLKTEDGEVTDFTRVKHYLIGNDDVIEVLSLEDPIVSIG